jgi:hypothetical protein
LRERHSLLWLISATVLLILSISRGFLSALAGMFGVEHAPSLSFTIGFLFTLSILIYHSVTVSALDLKNRDLAQQVVILEWQLRHHLHTAENSAPSLPSDSGLDQRTPLPGNSRG